MPPPPSHLESGNPLWLQWAIELQSIAQCGLAYAPEIYDRERYERLRDIAAEMLARQGDYPVEKVQELFCNETGYQTPKIDTRAAIFDDAGEKILLVLEKDGRWSLPGGWCDVLESVKKNTVKEVKEEAGLDVIPTRLIAVHDRNLHNPPPFAYGVCKIFFLCECLGGSFVENSETLRSEYFSLDELPSPLADSKCTAAQIALCFQAASDPHWQTVFD